MTYDRCVSCGAVFARNVTWLDRAYADGIAGSDIGMLDRCMLLSHVTAAILVSLRLTRGRLLDWAGGCGAFTRIMRDRGFDFSDYDPMAPNVFAGQHRHDQMPIQRFQAVTAFEVLEHLTNPVSQLADVAAVTDTLIATTQPLPVVTPKPGEWDYYSPDTGQHVTFYTADSLRALGHSLGFPHVVAGRLVHVFRKEPVPARTRLLVRRHELAYAAGALALVSQRRRSLLASDLAGYVESLRGVSPR